MHSAEVEAAIRDDVFRWLDQKRASGIEELARTELLGYSFGEQRIPLVDRNRGIRNPADFEATLSILTSPTGPYEDIAGADGLVHYAYRDGDPNTGDNRKLRRAMDLRVPLVYFQGVRAGYYVPVYPVYVVGDDLDRRTFAIALDTSLTFLFEPDADDRRHAQLCGAHGLAAPAPADVPGAGDSRVRAVVHGVSPAPSRPSGCRAHPAGFDPRWHTCRLERAGIVSGWPSTRAFPTPASKR